MRKMKLREIAELWKLYVANRATAASSLAPSALVVYEPLTGGWVGHEDEPIAIVVDSFPTFGGAAGHLKKMAAILDSRQEEWENVSKTAPQKRCFGEGDESGIAHFRAISQGWTAMVIAASRAVREAREAKRSSVV